MLRRVYVDVDVARRHVEQHHRARPAASRHQARVALDDRMRERAVANGAPVHVRVQVAARSRTRAAATAGSRARRAPSRSSASTWPPRTRSRPRICRTRSPRPATGGWTASSRPWCSKRKCTAGAARLCRVISSTTCPSSVATLFRNFRRAGTGAKRSRTATVVPSGDAASRTSTTTAVGGAHADRRRGVARARRQLDRRHRRDARQRLAAEAERSDARQIVLVADLARRVTGERERRIVGAHAFAVVAHPDQAQAAVLELDDDAARARVERVLDELLHDRRRTLDHLAGRDLRRELRR